MNLPATIASRFPSSLRRVPDVVNDDSNHIIMVIMWTRCLVIAPFEQEAKRPFGGDAKSVETRGLGQGLHFFGGEGSFDRARTVDANDIGARNESGSVVSEKVA